MAQPRSIKQLQALYNAQLAQSKAKPPRAPRKRAATPKPKPAARKPAAKKAAATPRKSRASSKVAQPEPGFDDASQSQYWDKNDFHVPQEAYADDFPVDDESDDSLHIQTLQDLHRAQLEGKAGSGELSDGDSVEEGELEEEEEPESEDSALIESAPSASASKKRKPSAARHSASKSRPVKKRVCDQASDAKNNTKQELKHDADNDDADDAAADKSDADSVDQNGSASLTPIRLRSPAGAGPLHLQDKDLMMRQFFYDKTGGVITTWQVTAASRSKKSLKVKQVMNPDLWTVVEPATADHPAVYCLNRSVLDTATLSAREFIVPYIIRETNVPFSLDVVALKTPTFVTNLIADDPKPVDETAPASSSSSDPIDPPSKPTTTTTDMPRDATQADQVIVRELKIVTPIKGLAVWVGNKDPLLVRPY